MNKETVKKILSFWFGELKARDDVGKQAELWWKKKLDIDIYIRDNFEEHLKKAKKGEYDDWLNAPKSTLAFIILLDQFSRHIYRNTPEAFAADTMALDWAKRGMAFQYDKELTLFERTFFYMPFEHTEDLSAQERSVVLFYELYQKSSPKQRETLKNYHIHAQQHRDIIKRFGRFPHRNEILGRVTSEEEKIFLAGPNSRF